MKSGSGLHTRWWNTFAIFTLLILLPSCASMHKSVPSGLVLDQREAQLMAVDNWSFTGKLGIKAPSESASVYMNWHQEKQTFAIDLQGPLGQGSAKMVGGNKQVTLAHEGNTYSAASASTLIFERFGWQLPVEQLRYWVRALPSPDTGVERELQRDAQGLLVSQSQQGWQIHYSQYQWVGEQALPGKIKAESETLGVRLILVVNQWQLGAQK